MRTPILTVLFSAFLAIAALAQETPPEAEKPVVAEPPMTIETMAEIIASLDQDAVFGPNNMGLSVGNVPVSIVFDVGANRMRILVPIASASALDSGDLMRMMQANFDTALDARYAVANGRLWSVFIHPLSQLEKAQFVSGLAQTVTLARNYGSSYSSGGVVFGGGDSGALYRELLNKSEEL